MKPQTAQQMTEWCQGRLLQGEPGTLVTGVSTDTRTIAPQNLFVALSGENFDGHTFLEVAAERGATAFLVSRELPSYPAGAVILVNDTLAGLQALASEWRKIWGGKVVGLTGSNGKTSTKDLVNAVLSQEFQVSATKGNLNNHIGLPLTVLAANPEDQVGVFEMGMNHPGEIAPLATISAPDAAIITNVGTAHIEFMKTREAIALEKGALAEAVGEDGCVILNADDDFTRFIAARTKAYVLTAGFSDNADVRVSEASLDASGSKFLLQFPNVDPLPVNLPVPGRHMIGNAALAAAAGYHFGLTPEQIVAGLQSVSLNKGRLQLRTVNNIHFLDDSYNANPDSMTAALDTLLEFPCEGRRIVVVGRMGERGEHATNDHLTLGRKIAERGFPILCAVGADDASLIADGADEVGGTTNVHRFATHAECAFFLSTIAQPTDIILVKGSRSAAMEKVIEQFAN